jgi:hypothetical protein
MASLLLTNTNPYWHFGKCIGYSFIAAVSCDDMLGRIDIMAEPNTSNPSFVNDPAHFVQASRVVEQAAPQSVCIMIPLAESFLQFAQQIGPIPL